MSLSTDRSAASRLAKEIGDLRTKEAAEARKEADATKRMNDALRAASRASNASIAGSYRRTAESERKKIEGAQDKRARHATDIGRKSQDLVRVQDRIGSAEESQRRSDAATTQKRVREDANARRNLAAANDKLRRDYEIRLADLEAQLTEQIEAQASRTEPFELVASEGETEPYDFFISHAWADKEDFVDEFVRKASEAGLRVWYDRFAIEWGEPVRQRIDEGLRSAYFGVAVLSPNFFSRPWTNYELDGIIQRDLSGTGRMLPIWHRLTQDDVEKYAPSLSGRLALSTATMGTDAIIAELIWVRDRYRDALAN